MNNIENGVCPIQIVICFQLTNCCCCKNSRNDNFSWVTHAYICIWLVHISLGSSVTFAIKNQQIMTSSFNQNSRAKFS